MKSNRNVKGKCIGDLAKESEKYFLGRYNRALLSHQMEQLFKLEKELRAEKNEMLLVKSDVQGLEMKVKQRAFSLHGQPPRLQHLEVQKLEQDIEGLRGMCDNMVKKVTTLTGGKVPLGEDSIKDYKPYLSQEPAPVPETPDCSVGTVPCAEPTISSTNSDSDKWNCSECTFANHPSLDTCEICEMPRITMGTNKQPHISGPCFCHPQATAGGPQPCHSFPPPHRGQTVATK